MDRSHTLLPDSPWILLMRLHEASNTLRDFNCVCGTLNCRCETHTSYLVQILQDFELLPVEIQLQNFPPFHDARQLIIASGRIMS